LLAQNSVTITQLSNKINEFEKKEQARLVNFPSEAENNYIFKNKKEIKPSIINKMLGHFSNRVAKKVKFW
jgi:hypothetical protein